MSLSIHWRDHQQTLISQGFCAQWRTETAGWKWVLKVQMESLLHNHHIVHLTFTLKWQIEAKNCSVCSKEPPSHSPEYLTLIKTLIQTNPLSHPTVSLPLSPPRHWSSDSSYQCAHGSGLVKGSNHPGGSSPHQHDRFPSTHIPTKTQTHMRLFARLLITTRGLHLVAPQQNRATDEIFLPCCVVLLSLLTSEELLGNFGKL